MALRYCDYWRLILTATAMLGCSKPERPPPVIGPDLVAASTQPDPESVACASCHQDIFEKWVDSQHANANRLVSDERDRAAFEPSTRLAHGSFITTMRRDRDGIVLFDISFSNGPPETFHAEAVIGITPLRQYLVNYPGNRLQVMDIAYDLRSNEWFNAFGHENRQPGEWGHWRGRSMTWNAQCAFCHMTGFEKKYDIATDAYNSTWKAMGISCTQCHSLREDAPDMHSLTPHSTTNCPMVAPEIKHPTPDAPFMDNCASCHARREELFGTFKPGDSFHDHFRLILPDQPGIFHADGQVLDEDFEYGSFMMSRMGHKGVTCLDCHDPHSAKLKLPVENNALCMQCHVPPGLRGATPIDPAAHMFHTNGTPGGRCVDCHMPENFYMVRDPRRDHGFTSPDPQLTIEHGIPNACNRCHQDQTPAWAAEWTGKWYGEKMNRRARDRARVIARYHGGDAGVRTNLLAMAQSEEIDAWRAALVSMLAPWSDQNDVRAFLAAERTNNHPLVRSSAIRAMQDAPAESIADPSALVRLDASIIRYERNPRVKPPTLAEVQAYLANLSDSPAGAMRQARIAMIENRTADANAWVSKAIAWDPLSAVPRHVMGRLQFAAGQQAEALTNLLAAATIESNNPQFSFELALAFAGSGDATNALAWLEETVRRDPSFGRGWYNLGLAYAGAERLAEAVTALRRAESILTQSGDPAYARATVHLRMQDEAAAIEALTSALRTEPGHPAAMGMLRTLRRTSGQAPSSPKN